MNQKLQTTQKRVCTLKIACNENVKRSEDKGRIAQRVIYQCNTPVHLPLNMGSLVPTGYKVSTLYISVSSLFSHKNSLMSLKYYYE